MADLIKKLADEGEAAYRTGRAEAFAAWLIPNVLLVLAALKTLVEAEAKIGAMEAFIAGEPIEVARPGYDDPLVWRPWVANTPTSKPLFNGPCLFRRALPPVYSSQEKP